MGENKRTRRGRRASAPVQGRKNNRLRNEIGITDFELIQIIGQGSTGIVWHARRLVDGQECAVKILDKQQIIGTSSSTRVVAEREILTMLDHPFVIQLHFAFQDDIRVYFVMDYAAGGDFYNFLKQFPGEKSSLEIAGNCFRITWPILIKATNATMPLLHAR
jgi:serine/threonine protein kinase